MDRTDSESRSLVWGEGPKPAVGMIIGEAPGAEEEKLGRPFVGASGRLLDEALEAAGASRDKFFITNVFKLRPPDNRDPTVAEIAEHRWLLDRELDEVDPINILTLGRVAGSQFVPTLRITRDRGEWQGNADSYFSVLPTFHPAYVLYNRNNESIREAFFGDVEEFVNASVYDL